MGLFSSKEKTPNTSGTLSNPSYSGTQYGGRHAQTVNIEQLLKVYREEELRRQKQEEDLIYQFQGLSIANSEYKRDDTTSGFQPSHVKVNSNLIHEFLHNDENYICLNGNDIYNLIALNENSVEFCQIKNLFTATNKRFFKVTNIAKIYNPYLLVQYKLMEKCYRKRYGHTHTRQLFHGTEKGKIDNICRYNFDWRLKGTALGHRYGQGVSFTPISYYATHYGDKTFEKIMIVANVLISNKCVGAKNTDIPPINYDTTTKENEHVFVKYEDNTFYPAYLIYYQGTDTSKGKHTRHNFLM